MAETEFHIPVRFVFTGTFKIKAASEERAIESAERHCGMTLGSGIHSSLDFDAVDWEFPVHPEKTVLPATWIDTPDKQR